MHASRVAREIRKLDMRAELAGVGGEYMVSEGVELLRHYKEFSFMGIIEVIANLSRLKKTLKELKRTIEQRNPDVLILVDFPGINLKLATHARKLGIKTCYYIAPKIWAWKEHRIKRIKKDVDQMFSILPFEKAYFHERGYEVEYVGNPLIEAIREYPFEEIELNVGQAHIAVLPGSRKQEISSSATIINEIARVNPQYHFHIAGVDNVDFALYKNYSSGDNISLHFGKTYNLLKVCNAAIVTSGTATLETALLNCPQVVVYRANPVSVFIARLLVKVRWISLVNLIADKTVVKELIQEEYTPQLVMQEIEKILKDHQYCAGMLAEYQLIRDKIGNESASKNVAKRLVGWLDPELA